MPELLKILKISLFIGTIFWFIGKTVNYF